MVAALGVAAACGLWVYRSRAAQQAAREHEPAGRFVDVAGVRLHYIERGSGDAVVLLHGNGAAVEDFVASGVVDLAARGHRVLAIDRPGFGHSERPRDPSWTADAQAALLERAFERLGVARPVVVGHSWGALVALALAARARVPLAGLVLMAGFYYPVRRADVALASPLALPAVGDAARALLGPLFGRHAARWLIAKAFSPNPIPERFSRAFPLALCVAPTALRACAEETALMIPSAAVLQKSYRTLTLPVTILAGAEDRLVEPDLHAERLHRDVPQSRLHVFAGLGHMLHHFVPRHVVAAVESMSRGEPL